MGSRLFLLKTIIELKKRVILSSELIKKRRYWTRYIKGNYIKEHFERNVPGDFVYLKGEMEDVDFYLIGLKDMDYVLLLITAYGSRNRFSRDQFSNIFIMSRAITRL